MKVITLDDLSAISEPSMGLIFGPGLSCRENILSQFQKAVGIKWESSQSYAEGVSNGIAKGVDQNEIDEAFKKLHQAPSKGASLEKIAGISWAALMSFAIDSNFENEAARIHAKRPVVKQPTRVRISERYEPRSSETPIFRMLGSVLDDDYVLTESDYLLMKMHWPSVTITYADLVQERASVCIGVEEVSAPFTHLVAQMLSDRRTAPARLILLAGDLSSRMVSTLTSICDGRCELNFIDCDLAGFASRVAQDNKGSFGPILTFEKHEGIDLLKKHQEIVSSVNLHLESEIGAEDIELLLDLLFSSGSPRWEPYYHKLDFKRAQSNTLKDALATQAAHGNGIPTYIVKGGAAYGKTVIARQAAFALAKAGELVLWVLSNYYHNYSTRVEKLLVDLQKVCRETKKRRVFVVVDDPNKIGIPHVNVLLARIAASELRIKLVLICRTLEYDAVLERLSAGLLQVETTLNISEELSESELEGLPSYLVRIGIHLSKDEASKAIATLPRRESKYVLGLLYWMIPQTKPNIENSIRSEHLKLGEYRLVNDLVVAGLERGTRFLREAYEFAAVADVYQAPLPTEVLCGALGVSYGDWVEAIREGSDIWGLLFSERSPSGDSWVYYTRNSIVAETIVKTINGGVVDRSGEVLVIRKLLEACSGSASLYRGFAKRVLARNSRLEALSYQEGLSLYRAAIKALKAEDRTVLHHMGIWIRKGDDDPLAAIEVLDRALVAPHDPSEEKGEADEHIRNSKAAVYLDAAKQGKMSFSEATPLILQELDFAKSDQFFNPSAIHVEACLIRDLLRAGIDETSADSFALVSRVMRGIDETTLTLEGPISKARSGLDLSLLTTVQQEIYECSLGSGEMRAGAEALWNLNRSQYGFVASCRRLFYDAKNGNQGGLFRQAYDYGANCISLVKDSGLEPSDDLLAVVPEIFYTWQTSRFSRRAPVNEYQKIDWKMLASACATVLQTPRYRYSPFHRFMLGVALAQSREWIQSNAQFAKLRQQRLPHRLKKAIRAVLLNEDGLRQRFQGKMVRTDAGDYFGENDLKYSFRIWRRGKWPEAGAKVDAYIVFSYEGFFASMEDPLS